VYASSSMLPGFVGSIWRHIPGAIRRRLVRLGQTRFTVTAGAMIFDDEGRILLLEHVFRPDSGWGIPGGFLARHEQPEEGLRRELREEIEIEVEDVSLLFVRTLKRPGQVEIYFRARAIGTPKPSSFEIKKAEWFAVDALPEELSKDQKRLIRRVISINENAGQ
jgi:8-oxo-dGTP diphosphatase